MIFCFTVVACLVISIFVSCIFYFFAQCTCFLRFVLIIILLTIGGHWPALMGICLFWQPVMFSSISLLIMFSLLINYCCVLLCLFVSQIKTSSSSSSLDILGHLTMSRCSYTYACFAVIALFLSKQQNITHLTDSHNGILFC